MSLDTLSGGDLGADRVLDPAGVLPQAARRLDPDPVLRSGEIRLRVRTLNLDAASLRQLQEKHGGDGDAVRRDVLEIVGSRGKMHNPVTGSGGMCIGVVEERHPDAAADVQVGDTVATLVSLTLTPLVITDGLAGWDGHSEQIPCDGHAVLFRRTSLVKVPEDVETRTFLSLADVCGAPALTARVLADRRELGRGERVVVLGAAGKSGSLSMAAAQQHGSEVTALVRDEAEADAVRAARLADWIVVADATDPLGTLAALSSAGGPADVVVVCVDAPGCEHAAILAARPGGTVIFFSMATSFSAAALGAEGMATDVTMLVGNGYSPGHAEYALELLRSHDGVQSLLAPQPRVPSVRAAPVRVTQRHYVSEQAAHYADGLVAGAYSLGAFGDVATELMIQEAGCEGLFAGYDTVAFRAPVQAGDVVETTATVVRRGRRSRHLDFELKVVARRVEGSRSSRLAEPLVATTARGVVVVPRGHEEGKDTP